MAATLSAVSSASTETLSIAKSKDEYQEIISEAQRQGLPTSPNLAARRPIGLAELIAQALEKPSDQAAEALATRASHLLIEISDNRRDGLEFDPFGPLPAAPPPSFESLRNEYKKYFTKAKVDTSHVRELQNATSFIISPLARKRYEEVQSDTGVPWYIIGVLHFREANLNFMGHLHNGDPLLVQTVQVPSGRPPEPWPPLGVTDPKALWRLSAVDALTKLRRLTSDWTVERMCYGFEQYNGFGYRHYQCASPYLWNYTQFYKRGGFPRDHQFSWNYHSKQAGLVAVIVELAKMAPNDVSLRFET